MLGEVCLRVHTWNFMLSPGDSPVLLRGVEGSHPRRRKETRHGGAERGAVVAQERNAHGHTREGSGSVCVCTHFGKASTIFTSAVGERGCTIMSSRKLNTHFATAVPHSQHFTVWHNGKVRF